MRPQYSFCLKTCNLDQIISTSMFPNPSAPSVRVFPPGAGLRGGPPRHRQKKRKKGVRRGHPEYLKCSKPFGGRGSAPDPAGGAYSVPPDPLAGGEGAGCPLPKNPTPALGPSGLASRPYGPRFRPPVSKS